MRSSKTLLCTLALSCQASAGPIKARECLFPEPSTQICYAAPDATPQNLNPLEVDFVARYLRSYQAQNVKDGLSPFWKMPLPDADNCGEWQVTVKGGTWVLAKLVGSNAAAVTFNDIANTIDGGTGASAEQQEASLFNCGTDGGQQGVIVNGTDPLYESDEFVNGKFTNDGIIIKLVHAPAA